MIIMQFISKRSLKPDDHSISYGMVLEILEIKLPFIFMT